MSRHKSCEPAPLLPCISDSAPCVDTCVDIYFYVAVTMQHFKAKPLLDSIGSLRQLQLKHIDSCKHEYNVSQKRTLLPSSWWNDFTHLRCVPVSALLRSQSSVFDICSSFGCGLQWSGLKYIFTMRYFCSLTAPWPEWPRVCWGRLSPWDSLCSVCLCCQCTAAILLPSSCTAQVPTHRARRLRCTGRGIVTTAYTG